MQKYQDTVVISTPSLIPLAGAVVTIVNTSGGSSTMYSDNGVTAIPSTTTNANGYFSFYAADGRYTITITPSSPYNPVVLSDILLEDPADGNTVAAPENAIINGACKIAQRAAVALTGVYQYGQVDRFLARVIGGTGISGNYGKWTTLPGYVGALSGALAASWTTGRFAQQQRMASANVEHMCGRTVTFSCLVYQDTGGTRNFAILITRPGATKDDFSTEAVVATSSDIPVPTGELTRISFTVTLGATDAALGLAMYAYDTVANTVVGKYYLMTEFSAAVASALTIFKTVDESIELVRCRRYCRVSSYYVPATVAQNLGTIDMRAVPTIVGGGAGFTSTGTTADTLIAYQTTGGVQTLTLTAEL